MSIRLSSRTKTRTTVAVIASGLAAGAALAVSLSSASGVHGITLDAAVSQGSATALCSASGSTGTWSISTTGIATLSPTSGISAQPCTDINLPNATQESQIKQCASELQAAQDQADQESASTLFSNFILNLIQNNASQWSSALSAKGYNGSVSASSAQVSNAISQAAANNASVTNAIAQALVSLLNSGSDTSVDCLTASDPVSNWYSNAYQALIDEQGRIADYVNQALQAVAGVIAQGAPQGAS